MQPNQTKTTSNPSYERIDLDALERRIFDYDHPKKRTGWSDIEKHALIAELRASRTEIERLTRHQSMFIAEVLHYRAESEALR